MQYTQAQIDRANAVNLEDFLRSQGETLIKSGREYRWKEHDSLTIRGNKWFRHSQSKGGYPVNFVKVGASPILPEVPAQHNQKGRGTIRRSPRASGHRIRFAPYSTHPAVPFLCC